MVTVNFAKSGLMSHFNIKLMLIGASKRVGRTVPFDRSWKDVKVLRSLEDFKGDFCPLALAVEEAILRGAGTVLLSRVYVYGVRSSFPAARKRGPSMI